MTRIILLAAALSLLTTMPVQAAGLKKGYAVCRTRPALTQLLDASVKNDAKRFARLLKSGCKAVRGTEKVRVTQRSGAMAQIRMAGQRSSWWTVVEALQ